MRHDCHHPTSLLPAVFVVMALVGPSSAAITHPDGAAAGKKPVQVMKPGEGGVFGYQPPKLDQEEDLGNKLPRRMHCDGIVPVYSNI